MNRPFSRSTPPMAAFVAGATLLIAACTAGSVVPAATPTAQVSTAPAPSAPPPSAAPSATPSPTAAPLLWTRASLNEDWPAPVRTEPAGPATIVPISDRYHDPAGDTESSAFPWTDIQVVGFGHNNAVAVYVPGAPDVDPTEQWIAYGLVVDDDGDGVGDRRFGMDNIPGSATELPHRAWITNLHTGRTESSVLNADDYTETPQGTVKRRWSATLATAPPSPPGRRRPPRARPACRLIIRARAIRTATRRPGCGGWRRRCSGSAAAETSPVAPFKSRSPTPSLPASTHGHR